MRLGTQDNSNNNNNNNTVQTSMLRREAQRHMLVAIIFDMRN
jgi:hypothetical protein